MGPPTGASALALPMEAVSDPQVLVDRGVGEGLGEMALACARRPGDDKVLGPGWAGLVQPIGL
jgi:hypothetical protein